MLRTMRVTLRLAFALGSIGCGGDEAPTEADPTPAARDRTTGGESTGPSEEGLAVEGLLGTLSPQEVDRAMQSRMGRLAGCFARHSGELDTVGGELKFSFRVKTDGSVLWVFPMDSDVGHRDVERCLLDVAKSTRFPRPHGGEAEFNWSVAFDPASDVRPPTSWPTEHVAELVAAEGPTVLSQCRPSGADFGYDVTAYVAPGGQVLAAGASVSASEADPSIDCVVAAVKSWTMPDPGSYQAKVTFFLR